MTERKWLRPVVGVEIGQGFDPTAICVAQPERRSYESGKEVHFAVRFLDRLAAGTRYPQVAERVQEIVARIQEMIDCRPIVYINTTDSGPPLHEFFRSRVRNARIIAVCLNHGVERTEDDGRVKLGMGHIVSRLQVLLQAGHLHLPETAEARILSGEIRDYKMVIEERADDRPGAFRVGTLDDLLIALGLAVQTTPRGSGYPAPPPYIPDFDTYLGLSSRSSW
jgi:hypothetical protein